MNLLANTICKKCHSGVLHLWEMKKEGKELYKIYKCTNNKCFTKTIVKSVLR